MPMRKSRKRNSRNRLKSRPQINPVDQEKRAKHDPEKYANLIMRFPDSSRDSVIADARSYRDGAAVRMAKANERRQKRNALRAQRRGNAQCDVNSATNESQDISTKSETLPIPTE